MEKLAKLYADMGCCPSSSCSREWSDQYKNTPLYKRALEIQKEDALLDVKRAKQRAESDKMYAEESAARVHISEIEAELAQWKYDNIGIEPSKTAEALEAAKAAGVVEEGTDKTASAGVDNLAALREAVIGELTALSLG